MLLCFYRTRNRCSSARGRGTHQSHQFFEVKSHQQNLKGSQTSPPLLCEGPLPWYNLQASKRTRKRDPATPDVPGGAPRWCATAELSMPQSPVLWKESVRWAALGAMRPWTGSWRWIMLVLLAWGTLLFYIGGHLVKDSEHPERSSRELSKILAKLERLKQQNEDLRRMAETLRLVKCLKSLIFLSNYSSNVTLWVRYCKLKDHLWYLLGSQKVWEV